MHRVLRPAAGSASATSSPTTTSPTPSGSNAARYVGCIAGALPIDEYEHGLRDAGFDDVIDHLHQRRRRRRPQRDRESHQTRRSMKSLGTTMDDLVGDRGLDPLTSTV